MRPNPLIPTRIATVVLLVQKSAPPSGGARYTIRPTLGPGTVQRIGYYTGAQTSQQPAFLPVRVFMAQRAEWQLPAGVSRGVWDYLQAEHVADGYDEYFAGNRLFAFDQQVVLRHFQPPATVVDLGCGTGRILLGLSRRGFWGLGVDLSRAMLRIVAEKAARQGLSVALVQANLVQLEGIRSGTFDYATCLFSTLGMIRGRGHRQQCLRHVRRILKPGGLFVLHVHNFWFNLYDPAGRRWLVRHLWEALWNRRLQRGDKYFFYRGIPQMYLHTFTHSELKRAMRAAGFRILEWIPLDVARQRRLPYSWLLGRFRANGWIVVCQAESAQ